jgi:hypothetical protein
MTAEDEETYPGVEVDCAGKVPCGKCLGAFCLELPAITNVSRSTKWKNGTLPQATGGSATCSALILRWAATAADQ